MSHFYGVLSGSRGDATRCGTKKSGLVSKCLSWSGGIRIVIGHNEETGEDQFSVYQQQHPSTGKGIFEEISSGIIGQPTKKENGKAELLECCNAVLDAWTAKDHTFHKMPPPHIHLVRAAIKKAEG